MQRSGSAAGGGSLVTADVLAILTAAASALTLAWTIASFVFTRERLSAFERRNLDQQAAASARDHHWRELIDALNYAVSSSTVSQVIGVTMLHRLLNADWVADDIKLLLLDIIETVKEN